MIHKYKSRMLRLNFVFIVCFVYLHFLKTYFFLLHTKTEENPLAHTKRGVNFFSFILTHKWRWCDSKNIRQIYNNIWASEGETKPAPWNHSNRFLFLFGSYVWVCDTQQKTITEIIVVDFLSFHFLILLWAFIFSSLVFKLAHKMDKLWYMYCVCSSVHARFVCINKSTYVRHLCDKYIWAVVELFQSRKSIDVEGRKECLRLFSFYAHSPKNFNVPVAYWSAQQIGEIDGVRFWADKKKISFIYVLSQ